MNFFLWMFLLECTRDILISHEDQFVAINRIPNMGDKWGVLQGHAAQVGRTWGQQELSVSQHVYVGLNVSLFYFVCFISVSIKWVFIWSNGSLIVVMGLYFAVNFIYCS